MRNKFFAAKPDIKETHPHIVEFFDNPTKDGANYREMQTKIIHNCFKPGPGGQWVMDLSNPFFKECKTRQLLVTWELIN